MNIKKNLIVLLFLIIYISGFLFSLSPNSSFIAKEKKELLESIVDIKGEILWELINYSSGLDFSNVSKLMLDMISQKIDFSDKISIIRNSIDNIKPNFYPGIGNETNQLIDFCIRELLRNLEQNAVPELNMNDNFGLNVNFVKVEESKKQAIQIIVKNNEHFKVDFEDVIKGEKTRIRKSTKALGGIFYRFLIDIARVNPGILVEVETNGKKYSYSGFKEDIDLSNFDGTQISITILESGNIDNSIILSSS